jgi:hypothetical protein
VDLYGSVQKGPFVIGSSVEVALLDHDLDTTGFVHTTETINDRGELEIGFTTSHPVALEGDGYFYNEITGALSDSALTLRALYGPPGSGVRTANINVVTHLTTHRIRALVSDGWPFGGAVARAERELVSALNITPPGFVPGAAGVEMSLLGGDTDANAFLLAVSVVLIQVAIDRPGPVEASLQGLLNRASLDLADGVLSPDLVEEVGDSLLRLNPRVVEGHLAARFVEIGASEAVPDMDRVIDQDRDGVANADDNCRLDVNPSQDDIDGDGFGDECDPCPVGACVLGEHCEPGTCLPGLVCASDSSVCPPGELCCLPAGAHGEHCYEDSTCDEGLVCSTDSSVCPSGELCCLHAGARGEHCYEDSTCDAGLVCVRPWPGWRSWCPDDFDSCCGRPGREGDLCRNAVSGFYWLCDEGFVCEMAGRTELGYCREAGGPGQPCPCDEGLFCVEIRSMGLGPNYWRCYEAGGPGQPCRPDHVCDEGLVCVEATDFGEPTEICRRG